MRDTDEIQARVRARLTRLILVPGPSLCGAERFLGCQSLAELLACVFRHPLHAVSDRDGHYRIDGIPVGSKVTIGASMAEINAKEKTTVEIKENVVTHAPDIVLTYKPGPPGGPANRAADGGIIPPWRMPNE